MAMPKNEKSGHLGCATYQVLCSLGKSPNGSGQSVYFPCKWLAWNASGLLFRFQVPRLLACFNVLEGREHSPFCSRCTPAARRSGSPRLMSFSLVPRHSIQRCLHHSSASSSAKEHTSSESAGVHRDDRGGRPPGPWAQVTRKSENSTRWRQKGHIQDVKPSPTIASHRWTFCSKVVLNYSDVLPLIYKWEDIACLCTIWRILD